MPYANLSDAENALLTHVTMFGSEGYPIRKLGAGKWIVEEAFGVKGPPIVYKTRREAVAQFERWQDVMRDKAAGRL